MNLNTVLTKALEELLNLPVPEIYIFGEIDDDTAEYIGNAIADLRSKGSPDIIVRIDSSGGDIPIGLGIYDILRTYTGNTLGIAGPDVHSMASIILQACGTRQMMKHSAMLIHNPIFGNISYRQVKNKRGNNDFLAEMKTDRDSLLNVYLTRSKKTRRELIRRIDKDTKMTAEEALAFGLIDEII